MTLANHVVESEWARDVVPEWLWVRQTCVTLDVKNGVPPSNPGAERARGGVKPEHSKVTAGCRRGGSTGSALVLGWGAGTGKSRGRGRHDHLLLIH